MERAVDGGEGGLIRCFKNERLGLIEFEQIWDINPFVFDCNQVSSISDLHSNQLKIYPNPVENILVMENEEAITTFQIFDLFGKEIKRGSLSFGKSQLELTNLKSGIYFIKVGAQTSKFIKQ